MSFAVREITTVINLPFTGYTLDSFREHRNGFTAQLNLAGAPCNAFGNDILNLTIQVTYETASRCVSATACIRAINSLMRPSQAPCQHL